MAMPEAHREARRWLRFAEEDLQAAHALLDHSAAVPRHLCWLAQQAAEKAIKSLLILLEIDFPYRHDLDFLRNLLPRDLRTRREHPDLAALTEWAVEARYPGEWPEATIQDASSAVEQATGVYRAVCADLATLGLAPDRDA